jgi:hypothetical protein
VSFFALAICLVTAPDSMPSSQDVPPPKPEPTLAVDVLIYGSLNPVKLGPFVGLSLRKDLPPQGEHPILRGLYVKGAVQVLAIHPTPSLGAYVEVVPLAVFKLRCTYEAVWFTGLPGNYGVGLAFPSATSPFDPATLQARKGEEQRTFAHHVVLTPTLQFKLGRFVAANDLELIFWFVQGPREYWYDPVYDTLLNRGALSFEVANRTIALIETWKHPAGSLLMLGLTNQVVYSQAIGSIRERLGVAGVFTLVRDFSFLHNPTIVLLPGINLVDRNRRYQPYVEVVLATSFRLL